ncbi:hypothetical protein COU17_00270 [Candidatus Kaiserbacteria bacterium CG10_big_fil_rev_8_21_14_0_10_49_17]|uniref:GlxA-like beta barrel domain-containing protein n=1 Tax=Candidatus Kaiserbacteria bacterium CG10_big_fil_rev_8_21_14_0_10_49_17 TaxID=1974609 RepID=A0A2M6WF48_9BACT|nr:MAG: hypothetical protein COU17_00270 [Candidatus Kaiserbacteria bacterium CG10_big_fil_rev_8_21_14_0_10_49_17]
MANDAEDIVPPEKRSIRKVTVSDSRRPMRAQRVAADSANGHSARKSRWGLWLVALISVAALALGLSYVFSGAKIVVTPKERSSFVEGTFRAYKNPGFEELGYEIATITQEESVTVEATGEEEVENKASGFIVIYNDYSKTPQRLIKNTRFESPDGRIYRIEESVTVPGQKTENGAVVPGSIEVEVFADEPGEEYNTGLTDFTIPGLKGDDRYDHFYARSKTPITGGFVGVQAVVDESVKEAKTAELKEALESALLSSIVNQIPDGFVLVSGATMIEYSETRAVADGDGARLIQSGTLYAVLFPEGEFASFLARNTIAEFKSDDSVSADVSALSLTVADGAKPWEADEFAFSLSGNTTLTWLFDTDQLLRDLAGKAKGALPTILSGYPSIEKAEVILRPFWRGTFPDDPSDITLELTK